VVEAYVSFDQDTPIGIQDFENFQSGYAANGKQYMVGQIKLEKLQQWSKQKGVGIILAPNSQFISLDNASTESVYELKSA
jgi:homoserine dehydrogenase